MKKILLVALVLTMVLGLGLSGCGKSDEKSDKKSDNKYSVVMVLDTGGVGDESFNQAAHEGLLRAAKDFDVNVEYLESEKEDDYAPNLTAAAEKKPDLVVAVGYKLADGVTAAAKQFPDQKFAIIDSVVEADNVMSLTFKENEGSFLVGYLAGKTTKTNTVGFIGGIQGELIERFQYGFEAGVKQANPDVKVLSNYTGSFTDVAKGKEAAVAQNKSGADVIFHASGKCGLGLIEAAGSNGFWAIGVDLDQSNVNPKAVLASMIKRVDNASYYAMKSVVEDKFKGEAISYGLADEGVGISDDAGNVTPELMDEIKKMEKQIVADKIKIPSTKKELDAFKPFTVK